MKIKLLTFMICFPVLWVTVLCQTTEDQKQSYEWEKIVLLVTKRADIEASFGKPIFDFNNGVSFVYETKFGKLGVQYKGKNDSAGKGCKWSVKVDTLIAYRISLTENIPVSKFKYDLTSFEKQPGHNNDFGYQNNEIGIAVSSHFSDKNEEWIDTIYYYPTAAVEKSKCKNKSRFINFISLKNSPFRDGRKSGKFRCLKNDPF